MRFFPLAFRTELRNNPHMEKELLENLLSAVDAYCAAVGKTRKSVAWRALNNNKFFDQVEAGGGWNVRTYDKLMQWLSDRWPKGAVWPEGVLRPEPQALPAEAEEEA